MREMLTTNRGHYDGNAKRVPHRPAKPITRLDPCLRRRNDRDIVTETLR
jgi:hypothetical protein